MTRTLSLALASASLLSSGCDPGPADDADEMASGETADDGTEQSEVGGDVLAEVAVDAGDAVSGESSLIATVATAAADAAADGITDAQGLAEAAAAENSLTAICAYGGTVTATVSESSVTYSFLGCSSHCGMHRATGDVVVDYSFLGDGVGVDVTAENFRIDGTTSDLDLSAEYRLNDSVASMSIDTDASIKGWFGWEITRSGHYDASFDAVEVCIEHEGEWRTTFGDLAYNTSLENYRRCALQCPEEGSHLAFEDENTGFTFDAAFTSPTTLEWSTSSGLDGSIELPACG